MDRTFIDSPSSNFYNTLLKKCMGKGHKKPKYFFNPRITEEWKIGGTLVVGINHWCIQKGCEHYSDCVLNSNSKKYDKQCGWAYSEVDDKTQYDLRYTTYEAFNCYFNDFLGYESFKEFLLYITGTQDCMEPEEQRKCWNNFAFYNYIQHFTKMSLTHTSMYGVEEALSKQEDEDFAAFLDVLHDLKPRLVIVWHKDIKNLLLQKIEEGKMPIGRSLQLVDDLGIPTKSMFRFVYQEKKGQKTENEITCAIDDFVSRFGEVQGFSTEQVLLRLLRWNMFNTEEDLALLTQLSVSVEKLKEMLDCTEKYAWDSDVLNCLVNKIQVQMGIASILNAIPYKILHYSEDCVVYSNVLLAPPPNINIRVCPLVGIYPEDCPHYSLKKYEERGLLSFTGLSFDGLRSKPYIDETIQAKGFVIYIDDKHPVSEAFFEHLFEAKIDKEGYSMLIMKGCKENDDRYIQILKESDRLHTIKQQLIGDVSYLFIKLRNVPGNNKQVLLEERKIFNSRLTSLLPYNVSGNGEIVLEKKDTETLSQKQALKRQISQMIEAKISPPNALKDKLTTVIYNGNHCGLLKIKKDNSGIEFNSGFATTKACYSLFCHLIYSKILKEYGGNRVDIIKFLFGFPNVANYTEAKIEADLEKKNLHDKVIVIKLCINCRKTEVFEAKFKKDKILCSITD